MRSYNTVSDNNLTCFLEGKDTKNTKSDQLKVAGLNVFRAYLKEKKLEEGKFLLYALLFLN